jgi:hypothetical protein
MLYDLVLVNVYSYICLVLFCTRKLGHVMVPITTLKLRILLIDRL